jgi:hypothetical protein
VREKKNAPTEVIHAAPTEQFTVDWNRSVYVRRNQPYSTAGMYLEGPKEIDELIEKLGPIAAQMRAAGIG